MFWHSNSYYRSNRPTLVSPWLVLWLALPSTIGCAGCLRLYGVFGSNFFIPFSFQRSTKWFEAVQWASRGGLLCQVRHSGGAYIPPDAWTCCDSTQHTGAGSGAVGRGPKDAWCCPAVLLITRLLNNNPSQTQESVSDVFAHYGKQTQTCHQCLQYIRAKLVQLFSLTVWNLWIGLLLNGRICQLLMFVHPHLNGLLFFTNLFNATEITLMAEGEKRSRKPRLCLLFVVRCLLSHVTQNTCRACQHCYTTK